MPVKIRNCYEKRKQRVKAEGGGFMKQTKHIWWTFSPWEADALRQYLEQLALEGWYPECIGTTGMKCRLGEPENAPLCGGAGTEDLRTDRG